MLSFLSLNARGLKNIVKRKAIFLFSKEQKANCIFLQETHSNEEDVNFWKLQWGDSIYVSHGTSHSAGVMILFNRFPGKVIKHASDTNGHWVTVIVEIDNNIYVLMCVYGYNERTKNKELITDLCKQINDLRNSYSIDRIIVGGNFNLAPDLWLDRNPPRAQCHKFDDLFNILMNEGKLIDYWRVKNPGTSQFSWFNASGNGQSSRIDFWLTSMPLINLINECTISASPLTDHCTISLSLLFSNYNYGLTRVWKFNNTLLNNSYFCKKSQTIDSGNPCFRYVDSK